jgi:CHAD domain-containing protein
MGDAEVLAENILEKTHRKLKKHGQGLAVMNAEERHQLRIRVKKVRYAGEFFATLFSRRKSQAYLHALRALQDDLGRLHDLEVARGLIASLGTGDRERDPRIARAGGLVIGWHTHSSSAREEALAKHWRAFMKAKPFWR